MRSSATAPGEVLEPASGAVEEIFLVRQGADRRQGTGRAVGRRLPVRGGRPVPAGRGDGAPRGDRHLPRHRRHLRAGWRRRCASWPRAAPSSRTSPTAGSPFPGTVAPALQVAYASQTLAEHSLETPLGELLGRARGDLPAADATARGAGADASAAHRLHPGRGDDRVVQGILTRFDVLGRGPGRGPLDTPIAEVMVQPVHTLTVAHTAQDAALLMCRGTASAMCP